MEQVLPDLQSICPVGKEAHLMLLRSMRGVD